jgi:hypothetical protein
MHKDWHSSCLRAITLMTFCAVALAMFAQQVQTSPECRMIKAADLFDLQAPRFDAYPVIREEVANPKLDPTSNRIARKYRTVLRLGITEGPNFAGHYRLVHWGCGTSCAMFAVVNLKTGRVITPEGFSAVGGVNFYADEFLPNTESDGWGFRHKSDSKLLVVAGALLSENDSKDGAFYFVLNDEKLHLTHSTLVRKACGGVKH